MYTVVRVFPPGSTRCASANSAADFDPGRDQRLVSPSARGLLIDCLPPDVVKPELDADSGAMQAPPRRAPRAPLSDVIGSSVTRPPPGEGESGTSTSGSDGKWFAQMGRAPA